MWYIAFLFGIFIGQEYGGIPKLTRLYVTLEHLYNIANAPTIEEKPWYKKMLKN